VNKINGLFSDTSKSCLENSLTTKQVFNEIFVI